jgi:hypothetical protein
MIFSNAFLSAAGCRRSSLLALYRRANSGEALKSASRLAGYLSLSLCVAETRMARNRFKP